MISSLQSVIWGPQPLHVFIQLFTEAILSIQPEFETWITALLRLEKPIELSGTAINPALPRPLLKHIPKCHTTCFEHFISHEELETTKLPFKIFQIIWHKV